MKGLWAIVAKDLVVELRLRHVLPTMFVLALVLVTVFGLAGGADVRNSPHLAAAILWLAFAFAALLAVEQAWAAEAERGTLAVLLASPLSRQAVFAAKCVSSFVLLAIVEAFTVPIALLFFDFAFGGPPWAMLLLLVLTDVALVVLGAAAGAMAIAARVRGPLMAVLVLPLLIPVLLVTTACSSELVGHGWSARAQHLVLILVMFDVVFTAAAVLLAPHVLES